MRLVGLKNQRPRRGTRVDALLRKANLKSERKRLPRNRDLEKLQAQAELDMARTRARLGLSRDD
jgi:hypothetical protein